MSTLSVLMSVYKKDNPLFLNQALISIWDNQILKPNQLVLVLDRCNYGKFIIISFTFNTKVFV